MGNCNSLFTISLCKFQIFGLPYAVCHNGCIFLLMYYCRYKEHGTVLRLDAVVASLASLSAFSFSLMPTCYDTYTNRTNFWFARFRTWGLWRALSESEHIYDGHPVLSFSMLFWGRSVHRCILRLLLEFFYSFDVYYSCTNFFCRFVWMVKRKADVGFWSAIFANSFWYAKGWVSDLTYFSMFRLILGARIYQSGWVIL